MVPTPARTIAIRLRLSWAIAPRQSAQLPSAAATPMLAAAGIVVTEISTPTSAPDLAEVSERTPAAPAKTATMKENSSGSAMNWVSGLSTLLKSASTRPVARQRRGKRKAAVIPTGKPIANAVTERRATPRRRSTAATQMPASGPNSGPTTIAPTIRIGEPVKIPTEAIKQARAMKARKVAESSMLSEVRGSTSSQTTASEGAPRAARSARSAARESCESICSSAIEPSRGIPTSFRSSITTLASSRATSQRKTSPGRWRAAPARKTRLQAEGAASSRPRPFSERSSGTTIRRWTMAARVTCRVVLTDYHLHLRPDEPDTRPQRYFTAENVERYREAAAAAGIEELGVSEHVYRFRQALDVWRHPFWQENAVDDIDAYCEFVRGAGLRLGVECDFVPGAEDRTANLLEAREFDYVVGSVHFVGEAAVDHEGWDVWEGQGDANEVWRRYFDALAECARSGLFDILADRKSTRLN